VKGAESALAAALTARLKAEPALAAWLGTPARVHDAAPAQPTYPYVTVGRTQSRPINAEGGGTEHRLTLTSVSQYGGAEEAHELTAALREVVDEAGLTLEGHRLVTLRVAYADVFRASDLKSVLGLLRLRAVTEPLG
jgi:hypothetical protein